MTTRLKCVRACCLALFFLIALPRDARADGGILRLRQTQGPFTVTIFTGSETVKDIPADISVLVQERDSNEAILDATVKLTFTAPASLPPEAADPLCSQATAAATAPAHPTSFEVPATRNQASNKLLYAAPVTFGSIGLWQLQASINRDDVSEKITCGVPVSPPPRKLIALFPYLILPPLLVALFATNHRLRSHSLEKTKPSGQNGRVQKSP